jgi:hypothetical protein
MAPRRDVPKKTGISPTTVIAVGLAVGSRVRSHFSVLSREDLRERGRWSWPHCSVGEGAHAAAEALEERGYEIAEQDLVAGTLTTAPCEIGTAATGGVDYASAAGDRLSWVVRVSAVQDGVEMTFEPSAYRGKTPMTDYVFVAELMDPIFDDLRELVERAIVRARGAR